MNLNLLSSNFYSHLNEFFHAGRLQYIVFLMKGVQYVEKEIGGRPDETARRRLCSEGFLIRRIFCQKFYRTQQRLGCPFPAPS